MSAGPIDPAELAQVWAWSRRRFLRDLSLGGGALAGTGLLGCRAPAPRAPASPSPTPLPSSTPRVPRTPGRRLAISACDHNCGGRCVLVLHIEDDRIVRVTSDDGSFGGGERRPETDDQLELRACLRGRAIRHFVHHKDRLTTPLLRAGGRGEGKWTRITWDEAYTRILHELKATREKHGPHSVFAFNGTGTRSLINNAGLVRLFLALLGGGFSTYWNAYSWQGAHFAQEMTLGFTNAYGGAHKDGNDTEDHLNSKLLLFWGWDPAQTIFGTNTPYLLQRCREKGIPFVFVDPAYTDSAAAWGGEWIPIRPGTDAAMLLAMGHVIVEEGLHDRAYVKRFVHGFDEYREHVRGAADGTPKTPRWAEEICGVPAAAIAALARRYATTKPAALLHSWAPGRSANGEQFHRAALALQALTGNIGRPGGSSAGNMETPKFKMAGVLESMLGEMMRRGMVERPLEIMGDKIADAILEGPAADPKSLGASRALPAPIRFLWANGGNFVNQMLNVNKLTRAVGQLDFMVVHDSFLTPTAKLADLVLPAATFLERDDLSAQWLKGRYVIAMQQAIPPVGESKSDFEVFADLSQRLGLPWMFGRSVRECIQGLLQDSEVADRPAFLRSGVVRAKGETRPWVAFREIIEDPARHAFDTPTGKIEILSTRLLEMDFDKTSFRSPVPALPTYIPVLEGAEDESRLRFPLQAVTCKFKNRVHSTQDNNPWLQEVHRHEMWIASADAAARGIRDGERVEVFNDRGRIHMRARVTERILPGVVKLWEGPWFDPGPDGVDRAGNPNVLTRDEPSPGGAYAFNTLRVEVKKA